MEAGGPSTARTETLISLTASPTAVLRERGPSLDRDFYSTFRGWAAREPSFAGVRMTMGSPANHPMV